MPDLCVLMTPVKFGECKAHTRCYHRGDQQTSSCKRGEMGTASSGLAGGTNAAATTSSAAGSDEANKADLIAETEQFRLNCQKRYRFNNGWDVTLSIAGLLLSIAIVAAGFLKRPEVSAILGAVVAAVLSAQKAFPFGQRVMFYRVLSGQAENLLTRVRQGLLTTSQAVDQLSNLRTDFAQQLPRGSSAGDRNGSAAEGSAAPATE